MIIIKNHFMDFSNTHKPELNFCTRDVQTPLLWVETAGVDSLAQTLEMVLYAFQQLFPFPKDYGSGFALCFSLSLTLISSFDAA